MCACVRVIFYVFTQGLGVLTGMVALRMDGITHGASQTHVDAPHFHHHHHRFSPTFSHAYALV